ncbi:uncharacterized protein LOC111713011 isoform X4 [Eurytemora carolleeae]|uniref:uncharacterized protein LOC111713011 isoform X4 n=1 Tax=Eurytemora carolleeae TaxID=1294199 RepID=UPI000C769B07|nr:uncharacterized protein LOC111713011 isoform X4 [Eurytemora carolleeae]|eukprot:XP_023343563.1 uncharacterized protein LOC111713011 isoform X4 [Eurytemora affinis]
MVILSACFLIFAQKDILAKYYLIKTAYQPQPITSAASVPVKYANGSDYRLHLNPEGPIATVKGAKPVGSAITLPPAVTAKSVVLPNKENTVKFLSPQSFICSAPGKGTIARSCIFPSC